ncbi:MAG: tripartite tricarboxylate transporter substrate binding protein BugD [Alphaproteobacteria bacterium]|nr:MAG: tripartite tricarboxylate transporter substrate binding protein BugD [Alphaproteobacteria bacterium]
MARLIRFVVVALAVLNLGPALSQDWPTRPVTMVAPFAAGGPADTVARILAPGLSELLGQQVIIENMGGSGGMTGAARVAKAAPDGYQFVLGNVGTHAANQTFYKTPLYNAATDFAPVMLIAQTPLVLLARKDLPADNLREFIAYAKTNQTSMQFGSGGAGSASHLACVLLNTAVGINVTHVPYRGAAPAMQDLIAGRIDYQCPDTPIAIAQIQSKMVKAIAILTRNRSPSLPAQATAHEQGLACDGCRQAPCCHSRDHQHPRCGNADAGDRGRSRHPRAQLARLSTKIRRDRDRKMGWAHQSQRSLDGLGNG